MHYRGTTTPVLVSAPFSTGRGLRTMPLDPDGPHPYIRAVVLRKRPREGRWQVAGGEHRAAVASALGFDAIPVRVIQIVHRDDVDAWPNVQAGVFSPEEALAVFDRIFDARPMPAADKVVRAPYTRTSTFCLSPDQDFDKRLQVVLGNTA